ncbi:TIGR03757 family integrating conjugative element protein [Thauera aromatica]|uniref:TIGR03757 family integrating conjugative element protein n=1 Tax=Thauera aromatica TaxID=59405 RepID=UPI001FFCFC23|nr:TIGR03757 family integrating conjugative element protein [Thauera aromatica]
MRVFLASFGCAPTILSLLLTTGVATAADVWAITVSGHSLRGSQATDCVIEPVPPACREEELDAGFPEDSNWAAALVPQGLKQGGSELQRRLGTAYQGIVDAWGLGIAKIPAVVVDRRYVVYGEPDVSRAVARINAYRSTQP